MKNWAMRQLLIWGGLALFVAVVVPRLIPRTAPVRPQAKLALAAPPAAPARTAASQPQQYWTGNTEVFPADAQGHVFIDALVNGAPVHFLVDTGATLVSLTMRDAQAAGIDPASLKFTVRTATANGISESAPVTLHDVSIDQIPVRDVPALVPRNLGVSLLGQSFLTRLRSYDMQNGQLTLDWN
jgi:aspartyl protease family protein